MRRVFHNNIACKRRFIQQHVIYSAVVLLMVLSVPLGAAAHYFSEGNRGHPLFSPISVTYTIFNDAAQELTVSDAYSYVNDVMAGTATISWMVVWHYKNSGLRVHMLSPKGKKIFHFRFPSVRLAGEDEHKLDKFYRNRIMQRHSGKASTFLAVHEPFKKKPWIESVRVEGEALLIRYKAACGKESKILLKLPFKLQFVMHPIFAFNNLCGYIICL
ncbi:hypothetical protein [Parapedobacter tibetensis]|uniref:hypothetical protein n=1 Tax=Parapedobacter tibetensis TaxID=2972951 RepID=UPI00214DAEAA|nr:hypothetical protein [Parapedobacter tibetensis]